MKIPTDGEIMDELLLLKDDMNSVDFQMGIGGVQERRFKNRLNKIIRMEKCPVRKVLAFDLSGEESK